MDPSPLDKQAAGCDKYMADEFGHKFSCSVRYIEVKIAPMDVIWLFQC